MKRIKILFSLIAFVAIMVSCNKDEASSADGFATVSFRNIGVDSEVISTITPSRSGEDVQTGEEVPGGNEDGQGNTDGSGGIENGGTETEEPFDPIVEAVKNGFKLSVVTCDETVYACTDYEKFNNGECENVELRVGNYTVFADLGNPEIEGFGRPYYSGSKDIHLDKGDNVDVDLECKLANSILKINYTDNFKTYFSTYSSYVSTSKGNTVEYAQDETRGAYMASGEVAVYVKAKKEGANEATLNVGKYTLNPQYEYALTLDVDVSKAVMTVTFSEKINEEPISIDISDAALNANPPYMTSEGIASGEKFSIVEGGVFDETLKVTINAEAGIASCIMTTTSDYLKEKGWSESFDFASADEGAMSAIKGSGVDFKGFSGSLSQMAYIDFTGLVRTLPKGSPVDVRLTVTDKLGKVSEEFVFLAETQDCMFSVSSTNEEVPFLGNECKVNVTLLEGDVNNVQFTLSDGGQPLSVQEISEPVNVDGVNQYTVTLKGTDDMQFINPFKVNAKYLTYDKDTETDLNVSYGILLDNGECDVWAKRAYMHVYNVPQNEIQSLKVQKKEVNGEWTDIDIQNLEVSGTCLIAKGLSSNTQQQLRVVKDGKEPTNILDIKTEEELQVPNAGFEYWYYEQPQSNWKRWFPWDNNVESSKGWNTLNLKTTSDENCTAPNYAYVNNSGTIETTDCKTGSKAALVRTVGWGSGTTAPGSFIVQWDGKMNKVDPGYLYLGENSDNPEVTYYPFAFVSRPSKLSFNYKYRPASGRKQSNDEFEIIIKVENRTGDSLVTLAEEHYKEGGNTDNYTYKEISIPYIQECNKYKATHIYILFKSGIETGYDYFLVPPYNNLSDGEYIGSQLYIDDVQLIYE